MDLRKTCKTSIAALLVIAALLTLTAAASADTSKAKWAGTGQVLFVGPSQNPGAPTTATAEFKVRHNGEIQTVTITTQNEFVAGVLAGGPGGGAITECNDRDGGATCDSLNSLLTGSVVSSLHTSVATLRNVTEGTVPVTLPTPGGPVTLDIPVLHGNLRGEINGLFILSKGADTATGTSQLKIKNGSTATYACFGVTPAGPVPLPSLDSCINQTGGQLFPIALNVVDRGRFEVGPGTGALSGILGLKGRVEVSAQTNLLLGQFGGSIVIPRAKAQLGQGELDASFWNDPALDFVEPD